VHDATAGIGDSYVRMAGKYLALGAACCSALLVLAYPIDAQGFFPLREVRPGLHGVGRTVFQGNRIEEFQVEILGVLENLGPKQSVILARLSGGPLAEAGIMQGMSGSPVYIDGRLLGAVALGFPFSKEPIAGIQPIEPMIADTGDLADSASRSVEASAQIHSWSTFEDMLRRPVRPGESEIPSPFGTLSELLTPLSLSGFTPRTLQVFAPEFRRIGFEPQQGVSAGSPVSQQSAGARTPDRATPGSMISVSLLNGDMNVDADGTVTYVNGKRIYAFGHRFLDAGTVEFPFAHSEVIAVVPTVNSSFKVSTPRQWAGTILSDRNTAISGEIGRPAHTVPVSVVVHSTSTRNHDYSFHVVNSRLLTPFITQIALFSVVDATERTLGASTIRLEGRARFEGGLPDLLFKDTFVSDSGTAQQASADAVVPLAFVLGGGFRDLQLKDMTFQISAFETKRQLRIAQAWLSNEQVRPGSPVQITALLQGDDGVSMTRTLTFRVPPGMPEGALNFTVSDANTLNFAEFAGMTQSALQTPAQLIETVNKFRDSEGMYIRVWRQEPSFTVGSVLPGGDIEDPPPSIALILADPSSSATSNAASTLTRGSEVEEIGSPVPGYVVSGAKTLQVQVKE
jgi:hypothetical protein